VIVTITLASAANLHLELNKLQEATGEPFLGSRRAIKLSAYCLIILLAFSFVLVIVKPLISSQEHIAAVCNSLAILIFYFNILVLFDLTRTVFKIPALPPEPGED
jgi:hypothetical protein